VRDIVWKVEDGERAMKDAGRSVIGPRGVFLVCEISETVAVILEFDRCAPFPPVGSPVNALVYGGFGLGRFHAIALILRWRTTSQIATAIVETDLIDVIDFFARLRPGNEAMHSDMHHPSALFVASVNGVSVAEIPSESGNEREILVIDKRNLTAHEGYFSRPTRNPPVQEWKRLDKIAEALIEMARKQVLRDHELANSSKTSA
jgi:hypothetical protein